MKPVGQNQIYLALDTQHPFLYTCAGYFQKERFHCIVLVGGRYFAMWNEHDFIDLPEYRKAEILAFLLFKDSTSYMSYEDHEQLNLCNKFTAEPIRRKHILIEHLDQLNQMLDLHFPFISSDSRKFVLHVFNKFNRQQLTPFSTPRLSL